MKKVFMLLALSASAVAAEPTQKPVDQKKPAEEQAVQQIAVQPAKKDGITLVSNCGCPCPEEKKVDVKVDAKKPQVPAKEEAVKA